MSQRVTDRVIEEIRSRIDIVDLIGARVTLKRASGSYKACCPFHKEKTPSFHVNPARQTYHCFGCGAHGDVFKFLMTQDGLGFMDAVRLLAERAGITLDVETDYAAEERNALYALHTELAAFYRRCLRQTPEAETARQYLASRKLSEETAERFNIGYAPTGGRVLQRWGEKHGYKLEALVAAGVLAPPNSPDRPDDYYDRFRGRLMFPICDVQGRVVAFSGRILDPKSHPAKYVNSPETLIFQKGRILYALDKARAVIVKNPRREAIICEGQIDVIRCHAAGFEAAVAAQGTAFTPEHVELLKHYADSVLLVFDGDPAGHKATLRTGALLLAAGLPVRVVDLPPGDDPDSLIRDQGPDAFRALLETATSLTAFQVQLLRSEERDPEAVDAVSRMARTVCETLAACPEERAVLWSHLLQEAAAGLHVPLTAMEQELKSARQRLAAHPPPRERSAAAQTVGREEQTVAQAANPPPRDVAGRKSAISDTQRVLCELLIHHVDDPEVAGRLERLLPPDLELHPRASAVLAAWRAMRQGDDMAFARLAEHADEGVREFVSRVMRGDTKIAFARDSNSAELADDIIAALWIERLQAESMRLAGSVDHAEMRRRGEIATRINRLRLPANRHLRLSELTAEFKRLGLEVPVTAATPSLTPASAPPAAVSSRPAAPPPVADQPPVDESQDDDLF